MPHPEGQLFFDKKAPCAGNGFKKENSLNVSCSCCRKTNDHLQLQDLPIAFCKLCQQNLQQGQLSFDKKAPCVGNGFKKENSLNVSCSCCRIQTIISTYRIFPLPSAICVNKLTAVGNKNFDSSILQISEDGQGIVTDTVHTRAMCNYADRLAASFFHKDGAVGKTL